MDTISLSDLVVNEGRIRQHFDDKKLRELAESIWRVGLLQPPVLRDDRKTLLAGERRTRAVKMLAYDQDLRDALLQSHGPAKPEVAHMIANQAMPYNVGSEHLSESELLEAELFENIHRENVTWQEQTAAYAKLHELRVEQRGEGSAGTRTDLALGGQTIKDTAQEIFDTETPTSGQQAKVSQALDLAKFLDDPMVASAPDEKTAMKVVQEIRAAASRKAAAVALEGKSLSHNVIHGDVYELLARKDSMVVNMDIIVCDPPYGRDMNKHSFENRHDYADDREEFNRFCNELLPLLYSTAAGSNAHLYVFSDIRDQEALALKAFAAGWNVWNWPLIWDKGNVGSFGNAKQGPRHCYDAILYGWKGNMQPTAMFRDVIPINQQQQLGHPAGKPIALYMDLLNRSAIAGMRAFDPMVGGGTFFNACSEARVYGTGVELSEKYYHMSMERVGVL